MVLQKVEHLAAWKVGKMNNLLVLLMSVEMVAQLADKIVDSYNVNYYTMKVALKVDMSAAKKAAMLAVALVAP